MTAVTGFNRKHVLGATFVALLVIAGTLIWTSPWQEPRSQPLPGTSQATGPEVIVGVLEEGEERESAAQLPDDPQRVTVGPGETVGTSLLLRVVRRASRRPGFR